MPSPQPHQHIRLYPADDHIRVNQRCSQRQAPQLGIPSAYPKHIPGMPKANPRHTVGTPPAYPRNTLGTP